MSLEQLYQQIILEHAEAAAPAADWRRRRFRRGRRPASPTSSIRSAGTRSRSGWPCRTGKVAQLRWDGAGCSISMASASVLADLAEGMDVGSFTEVIDNFREVLRSRGKLAADPEVLGDASAFEGVSKYAARVKCAMISWVAAEDALAQALAPSTPAP